MAECDEPFDPVSNVSNVSFSLVKFMTFGDDVTLHYENSVMQRTEILISDIFISV